MNSTLRRNRPAEAFRNAVCFTRALKRRQFGKLGFYAYHFWLALV